MNRFDEALEHLERAAEGMPERARVFYNLGLTAQAAHRFDEAETALRRAVELEPSNFDAMYALADHYVKRGEYRKALPIAERMIAAEPTNPAGGRIKGQIENALRPDTEN
jgi:tetratricopeptide (TPR) repeat protein